MTLLILLLTAAVLTALVWGAYYLYDLVSHDGLTHRSPHYTPPRSHYDPFESRLA